MAEVRSPAPAVADTVRFGPPGRPAWLFEVPHGATERADFEAVARRLAGTLPEDLAAYFHVNTDEGAPELAVAVARRLARRGLPSLVVRCRIPRTFVDANRRVTGEIAAGMSAGIPPYLTAAADRAFVLGLHAEYQRIADQAYAEVCGAGGFAVALHTYAPRSVAIEVDERIVAALRDAYRPARYRGWMRRPEVDLITRTPEGETFAPAGLAERLRAALAPLGLEVGENATYTLHPATAAHARSLRWPGRILCMEVRRDLLGSPWIPFGASRIGPRKTERLAAPLAETFATAPTAGG